MCWNLSVTKGMTAEKFFVSDTMYQGEREDGETMRFYRKSTGGSMVTEVNAIYNGQT